jgi:hypothetical protein
MARWSLDPWYMWVMVMLIVVALGALILGEAPTKVIAQFERPVVVQLAVTNLIGAAVIMVGLHLRNWEVGINLELAGAASLFGTLVYYWVVMLSSHLVTGTAYGLGAVQVFIIVGMTHRCLQICTLKWARWRGDEKLERKVTHALTGSEDGSWG